MTYRLATIIFFLIAISPLVVLAKPPEKGEPRKVPGTVIELGGVIDRIRSGGAGRYYAYHVKDAEKIAVVDVVAQKVVKEIPAPGSFQFAVDADKLILVLNDQRVIQRWDLKSLTREKTVLLNDDRPVQLISMGSAGTGPLALWNGSKVQFWNVSTLKPLVVHGEVIDQAGGVKLWPSADGQTFCAYGWSSGPYYVMRLSNVAATSVDCTVTPTPDGEDFNEAWAMPSADGSLLVRHDTWMFNSDMGRIDPGPLKGAMIYPTEDRRFLLAIRWTEQYSSERNTVSILAATDRRILYTIKDVDPVSAGDIPTIRGRMGPEPRVHYLSAENLLVTIPESNDQVIVRSFDLARSLAATKADYLFVISKPPTRIKTGTPFEYQIQTLSGSGGVKYKLEDGPPGMAVSESGRLTWANDSIVPGKTVGVILNLTDSAGQDVTHTLEMTVVKDLPTAPEAKPKFKDPADSPVKKVTAPGLNRVEEGESSVAHR